MTFKHGQSGNPNGRHKGTGYRQQLFNSLVEPHRDALFSTAISLALSGNESMIKLFLERMLPARPTDNTINIEIPHDLKEVSNLLQYGENTLRAISQGHLTPYEAKIIMGSVDMQRKNIEVAEIVDRVTAIEQILKQRK